MMIPNTIMIVTIKPRIQIPSYPEKAKTMKPATCTAVVVRKPWPIDRKA